MVDLSVEFRLLGPMQAWVNGRPVRLGPRQQRLVLAVLALEVNRTVSVEQLVDLIWPAAPPRTAVHAVSVCISRLRSLLAPASDTATLVRQDNGYLLRADPMCVDAHSFRALVRQARVAPAEAAQVALLAQALDLWSGPALAGLSSPQVRLRLCGGLEEARSVAVEDLLELRLRRGGHRELLDQLTGLVAANPQRERLVELLMLAHYRSGRPAAALGVYERARVRMADELGADPSGPLQRLHLAILRADPALDAPPTTASAEAVAAATAVAVKPAQLPPAVAGFVGRAGELAFLEAALACDTAAGGVAITAIGGTAGVGKTALAIHWAHRVAAQFPDGQLYLDLRGFGPLAPMTPTEAVRAQLTALGVGPALIPANLDAQVGLLRTLLADRRMLLVLDNAASAEQVRPLLPGGPQCRSVVTSRILLTGLVAGEGARLLTLDVLTAEESVELLANRLGRERVDAQPWSVCEIVERCARLPLALAVVAARAAANPQHCLDTIAAALRGAGGHVDPFMGADHVDQVRAKLTRL